MATNDPDEGRPDDERPFKGTPFEQFFGSMNAGQMPDLGQIFGQIQSLLQPYDGPLNWDFALDLPTRPWPRPPTRRRAPPSRRRWPTPSSSPTTGSTSTTDFPSGVTTATAWSRAEWVVNTTDVWKVLVEPVAQQSVGAMGSALPEGAQEQAAPILGILGKAISLLANQVGSGLGTLAGEVLSVSDIGIPLCHPRSRRAGSRPT